MSGASVSPLPSTRLRPPAGRAARRLPLPSRQRVEAIIEWLIALLDELDGDADLEPGLCGDIDSPHAVGEGGDDDGEGGDDNGLADYLGAWEQRAHGF